jgi:ribonuclease T1
MPFALGSDHRFLLARLIKFGAFIAIAFFAFCALTVSSQAREAPRYHSDASADAKYERIAVADLPPEGQAMLKLIKQGGPFAYFKDGSIFGNRERILPRKERGYYKEYTVKTPGASNRGARRIIAGGNGEYYYTDNHYSTFRRIQE